MNLIYRWLSLYEMPPRWMCSAYYSAEKNSILYVAFPLNLIVALAWYAQDRWARAANAPSWIEREVRTRQQHRDAAERRKPMNSFH